jgi:multidrug efflux pump subunit AcrA (membrane-fusion protein)
VLRIDPADYELALAQSQADLATLEAERAQLASEAENTRRIVALEQDRLALAETDLERTLTLVAQGTAPQSRADEAQRATLLARRTVAELENALALIPSREARIAAQVARSEAAIDRARRSLDRTVLSTPFVLRVTEVNAERFETVAPGRVLIRGDGIAAAEVVAHLPIDSFRRLIGVAAQGMTLADMMRDGPTTLIDVTLSPLSDPSQTWPARVTRIEGALDARARTVPVVVTVDAPYEGADPPRRLPLVPNMQVKLAFSGASLTGAIALPEAALHGGFVRVAGADDLLELRPVTAAFAQDGRVVIAEGLVPGERVVIDDIAPAIPGMALTPVEVLQ